MSQKPAMPRTLDHREIVIASNNFSLLGAVQSRVSGVVDRVHMLREYRHAEPVKPGKTLQEDAESRAIAAAKAAGIPALAESAGLEVDVLDGQPGPRISIHQSPDQNHRSHMDILEQMRPLRTGDLKDRSAQLVTVLALAWPDGHVETVCGTVRGVIPEVPRGKEDNGFDAIFQPYGDTRTLAQMKPERRSEFSSRNQAFDQLIARHIPQARITDRLPPGPSQRHNIRKRPGS